MQLRELLSDLPFKEMDVVPMALQQLLQQPLDVYQDKHRTERLLKDARLAFPERLELSVALFKLYAYNNRFAEALELIDDVLHKTALVIGCPTNWRQHKLDRHLWDNASGARRLHLYTMKACGFVNLRRGDLGTAVEVLEKLAHLDPDDQVGGSVVWEMAERLMESDY